MAPYIVEKDPLEQLNLSLFSIQPVPGKGTGVVARFDIEKGERIIYEKPLFTIPAFSTANQIDKVERDIAATLKTLSKDEQRQFLSLHNNFPGKQPFNGIVRTNALPCGSAASVGGVYPKICRINHSCIPNAHNSWNSKVKCESIHAIRSIKAGEEITISYDKGEPQESRRNSLRNAFGFDCSCTLCNLPPDAVQASDTRRLQIQILDNAIGDSNRVMNRPGECLADCYSLLHILDEEYEGSAFALKARLYYDAFQISISHSDQARALVFAERGYKSRIICEGEDSPETQKMKGLMFNPAAHSSFGFSRRWRTAKELVPQGLDDGDFEKWLWRLRK